MITVVALCTGPFGDVNITLFKLQENDKQGVLSAALYRVTLFNHCSLSDYIFVAAFCLYHY